MVENANLVVASAPTGLIVRGGPGVRSITIGDRSVVVDDMGLGTATRDRLRLIASDVGCDPIAAIFRHFAGEAMELFALVVPTGVLAGSSAADAHVWADPIERTVAIGLSPDAAGDWLRIKAGTAVYWGLHTPHVLCDIEHRSVQPLARELSCV